MIDRWPLRLLVWSVVFACGHAGVAWYNYHYGWQQWLQAWKALLASSVT